MTESSYTSALVNYLKNAGCIVFKHADRFTTGIPDLSVTTRGFTTWFEIKFLKRGESATERVMKDRVQFFSVLALSSLGRAFYLIRDGSDLWVFHPQFLKELDDMKVAGKQQGHILQHKATLYKDSRPTLELLDNGPVVTAATNYQLVLHLSQAAL